MSRTLCGRWSIFFICRINYVMKQIGKSFLQICLLELAACFIPCLVIWTKTGNSQGIFADWKADIVVSEGDSMKMNAEQFLAAIIAADYSPSLEDEALCALAVAARSRLYLRMEMLQKELEETDTAISAQLFETAYWSLPHMIAQWQEQWPEKHWSVHYERILEALERTAGEVLYEEEKERQLIDPVWHLSSAGNTRTYPGSEADETKESWYCPILHSLESYDRETEGAFTLTVYTRQELAKHLWEIEGAGEILDENLSLTDCFTEEERDEWGYLTQIVLGDVVLDGNQAANLLEQPSSCFYMKELSNHRVAILCMGRGSGYGMSLSGASQMARGGADYREILAWYYPAGKLRIIDSAE